MANGKPTDTATRAKEMASDALKDVVGKDEWKRSKVGYLLGTKSLKAAAGSLARNAGDSKSRVKGMLDLAFRRERGGVAVSEGVEDTGERFRAAMEVNGRSFAEVNASVDNTHRQFWLFALTALAGLAFALLSCAYALSVGGLSVIGALFRFLPVPLAGALALRAGYTNWMFRRRRLDTMRDYLSSGAAMLPRKAPPKPTVVATRGVPAKAGTQVRKAVRTVPALLVAAFAMSLATAAFDVRSPAYAQATAPAATSSTTSTPAADGSQGASDPSQIVGKVTADPNQNDLFIRMLSIVIPGVGPVPQGAFGDNPAAKAMLTALGIFAGILLAVGVTVNAYQILSGLVASAKEGTALGQKYHEVWAPVRVVVGYGFLTPMFGGLCAAQILVVYLMVWGGNLANVVWGVYTDTLIQQFQSDTNASKNAQSTQTSIATNKAKEVANNVVKQIADMSLCEGVVSAINTKRGNQTTAPTTPVFVSQGKDSDGVETFLMDFSDPTMGSVCGGLKVTVRPSTPQATDGSTTGASTAEAQARNLMDTTNKDAAERATAEIYAAAKNWAQTYIAGATQPRQFSQVGQKDNGILLQQVQSYSQALTQAAQQAFSTTNGQSSSDLQNAQKIVQNDGWASAGAFYLTIGRIQNAIYSGIDGAVASSGGGTFNQTAIDSDLENILRGNTSAGNPGVLTQFDQWYATNVATPFNTGSDNTMLSSSEMAKQFAGSPDSVWSSISTKIVGLFNQTDMNPFSAMQAMIDFGHKLIYSGIGLWIGVSGGQGILTEVNDNLVSKVAQGGVATLTGGLSMIGAGIAKGVITGGLAMAGYLAIGLVVAGIVHAYVIPLVPYIQTMFFVVGMLVLAVESMVAAPIWAFFHIRMDGDEFVNQVQHPGYMIVFNLLLRPTLMIFGLVMSFLVFGALTFFVSHTFTIAAAGMAGSGAAGAVGGVAMAVMVTYLHYQAAIRSFHLITEVPDRVARWFGHGGEHLGESQNAEKISGFAVGRIESNAGSLMQAKQGSSRLGKGPKPENPSLSKPGGGDVPAPETKETG